MKFSLVAAVTLAISGLASAGVHPAEYCTTKAVATEPASCSEFAVSKGLPPAVFAILNHGTDLENCSVTPGNEYCIAAPRTKAKRCLAEKKKAEKAAAEKAAAEKAAAEKEAAEKAEEKPEEKPAAPASGAPSVHAIPRSKTGGLNLVNKINPDCQWYYTILPADEGCDAVAAKNNIPVSQLYSLNKNLHSKAPNTCDNLDTGKTYCVSL
ncbi:hypothetical protein BX666DRAFT_2030457 [Dichotomocladium elegans]|nr:hypothetical protein BX666DRAFT_2030457 [Dichotomocladium elegans]